MYKYILIARLELENIVLKEINYFDISFIVYTFAIQNHWMFNSLFNSDIVL